MPTSTFTTTFTITSNASSTNPPGFSEDLVSFSATNTAYGNNDSSMGNVTLAPNQTQTWYEPQGDPGQVPDLTYAYIRAASTNSSSISVVYTSGSTSFTMAKLLPGAWFYAPVKVVSGSGASATSSSIKLVNDSGAYTALAYALYVESGSTAI